MGTIHSAGCNAGQAAAAGTAVFAVRTNGLGAERLIYVILQVCTGKSAGYIVVKLATLR